MNVTSATTAVNASTSYQAINIAVANLGLTATAQSAMDLVKMMEQSVNPHLGGNLDIRL